MQSIARADFPQGSSTVVFLRPRPISLKNDAKPRYTFAQLPNDSAYEKHGLQNYAKRFVSIRSQKLYPVELQAHDAFLYDRSGSDSTQESANLPSFDELKGQRNTSPAGTTWRGLDSAVEEHARIIFFVSQIRDASDQSHIPSDVVFT